MVKRGEETTPPPHAVGKCLHSEPPAKTMGAGQFRSDTPETNSWNNCVKTECCGENKSPFPSCSGALMSRCTPVAAGATYARELACVSTYH